MVILLTALALASAPSPASAESMDNTCRVNWWGVDSAVTLDLFGAPATPTIVLPLVWWPVGGHNTPEQSLEHLVVSAVGADDVAIAGDVALSTSGGPTWMGLVWRPAEPLALGAYRLRVVASRPTPTGAGVGGCGEHVVDVEVAFTVEDVVASPVVPSLTGAVEIHGQRAGFPRLVACVHPRAVPCPGASPRCYADDTSFFYVERFAGLLGDLGPRTAHYFAYRATSLGDGQWQRARTERVELGGGRMLDEEPPAPATPTCHAVEVLDVLFDELIARETFCAEPASYSVEDVDATTYARMLASVCDGPQVADVGPADAATAEVEAADPAPPGSANGAGSGSGACGGGPASPSLALVCFALVALCGQRWRPC